MVLFDITKFSFEGSSRIATTFLASRRPKLGVPVVIFTAALATMAPVTPYCTEIVIVTGLPSATEVGCTLTPRELHLFRRAVVLNRRNGTAVAVENDGRARGA